MNFNITSESLEYSFSSNKEHEVFRRALMLRVIEAASTPTQIQAEIAHFLVSTIAMSDTPNALITVPQPNLLGVYVDCLEDESARAALDEAGIGLSISMCNQLREADTDFSVAAFTETLEQLSPQDFN